MVIAPPMHGNITGAITEVTKTRFGPALFIREINGRRPDYLAVFITRDNCRKSFGVTIELYRKLPRCPYA